MIIININIIIIIIKVIFFISNIRFIHLIQIIVICNML